MPKKIILIGDSAGGNLVAALTIKIIKSGYRIPDGIVMAYPGFILCNRAVNMIRRHCMQNLNNDANNDLRKTHVLSRTIVH